jgi:RNase P/RNase MRP subunit p29
MKKIIFPHEIIGEEVEVHDAKNKDNIGIKGKVADETKSTLTIESNGKMKQLLKNNITLKMSRTGELIKGINLVKRPEERIKG